MPPRLGFTKSRKGCHRCKQRRVKCDENLPCAACVRHGLECVRTGAASSKGKASPSSQRSTRTRERATRSILKEGEATSKPSPRAFSESDPLASLTIFSSRETVLESDSQWRTDLRLMNHFTAITCQTLPKGTDRDKVWQLTLPNVAVDYDFLMHQILAITAHHMASLYPQERSLYSLQASQHQNTAIQGLRRVVPNVNSTNCHAVFATASLLSIAALATHAEHVTSSSHGPTLNNLLETFSLIRGMHKILKDWEPTLKQGPLRQLLHLGDYDSETALLRDIMRDLACLEISSDVDLSTQMVVKTEASMFIECILFACQKSESPELRALNIWPIYFSEEFFSLMQARQEDAVKLLEHYCHLLDSAGRENWYIRGWGKCVRDSIFQGYQ